MKELVRLAACDPHLNQTKLNGLLPLPIPGVLVVAMCAQCSLLTDGQRLCAQSPNSNTQSQPSLSNTFRSLCATISNY